jgi:HPt (histidine-containing phosphotransfer) domain-containing protein
VTAPSSSAALLDRARIAELAEKLEPELLRGFLLEAVIEAETARRRLSELAVHLEEAGRVAHRLRGTALNLGLARVGGLAAAIEADAGQSERLATLIEELEDTVAATREAVFRLHIAGLGGRTVPPRGGGGGAGSSVPDRPAEPGPPPAAGPAREGGTSVATGGAHRRLEAGSLAAAAPRRAVVLSVDGHETAVNLFVDGVHGFAALSDGVVKLDLYEDRIDYDPGTGSDLNTRRRRIVARLTMTRAALGRMLHKLATSYRVSER